MGWDKSDKVLDTGHGHKWWLSTFMTPSPVLYFLFFLLYFQRNVPGSSAANIKESWKLKRKKKEISTKMKKSTMKSCSIIQHSLYNAMTVHGLYFVFISVTDYLWSKLKSKNGYWKIN